MRTAAIVILSSLCFFSCLSVIANSGEKVISDATKSDADKIVVLSGDIGGTNARLRLSQLADKKRTVLVNRVYGTKDYPSFEKAIDVFIAEEVKDLVVDSIVLSAAGPIVDGKVKMTNSPWIISVSDLSSRFKIGKNKIRLLNDFEAVGYGLESLDAKDLITLQKGRPQANRLKAFLGAGTGLGVGFAYFDGTQYVVHATEGGHTSFAPSDDLQIGILKYLREKYNRDISAEDLLSGRGNTSIYKYFRDVNPYGYEIDNKLDKKVADNEDVGGPITDFALANPRDQLSTATMETFVKMYGSKTGDLAFSLFPRGGIYIVGNIARKLLTKQLYADLFMQAFKNKDKVAYVLKEFPVCVVTNTEVGLLGAENYAFRMVSAQRLPK